MRFRTFRHGFGPFAQGRPFGYRFGWWGPFQFASGRSFGFGFAGAAERPFQRRAYLRWLRRYRAELEEELRDVEDELRELERAEPKEESVEA